MKVSQLEDLRSLSGLRESFSRSLRWGVDSRSFLGICAWMDIFIRLSVQCNILDLRFQFTVACIQALWSILLVDLLWNSRFQCMRFITYFYISISISECHL